jgi:auxin efflux carrier family protein
MDKLAQISKDSVAATISLLLISTTGIYLVKRDFINKEKLSLLSKLVEQVFTPCLIFASFVQTLEISDI